jgi:hypothetical protein
MPTHHFDEHQLAQFGEDAFAAGAFVRRLHHGKTDELAEPTDTMLRCRAFDLRRNVHAEFKRRLRASSSASVVRRGLANWSPEGFIGRLFKTIGKYIPPAPGVKSPALWGTKAHLRALFGSQATVAAESKYFAFRYKSPKHRLELFRGYNGPVLKAFAAIDPKAREALEVDLNALLGEFNVAEDGTLVAPSEYLEIVITKKG